MSIATLLQSILNDLALHAINVKLEYTDTVYTKEGTPCSGFMDKDVNTFCVAIQDENWFLVLLHEYCHFKQEREGLWSTKEELELFSRREKWALGQEEMDPEDVLRATRLIQACELDCEKRVVQILKTHAIPVDIEDYIRQANAYVLSYEYERQNRKVVTGAGRTSLLMSATFITDFATLPPGYNLLIEKQNDEASTEANSGTSSSSPETGNNV